MQRARPPRSHQDGRAGKRRRRWLRGALLGTLLLSPAATAATAGSRPDSSETPGLPTESLPPHLRDIGVDEHLGAQLPFDLEFVDETGHPVRLADLFRDSVPVIITLNYSNCPMLCSLQLTGLVDSLKRIDLDLGTSYRAITVSLDPRETPDVARRTQTRYLNQYGHPERAGSWPFLTGTEENIRALARAVGFNYTYDPAERQYYHAASIALASPRGQLVRYLYGIEYPAATLKLSLVEASRGKIGSTLDKLVLFCSAFDPRSGGYVAVASRIVSIGSALTLIGLTALLLLFWRRESHKHRNASALRTTVGGTDHV